MKPPIAVLTALPKEHAAVRAMMDEVSEIAVGGRRYDRGTMPGVGGVHEVILAQLAAMGNNAGGIGANQIIADFPSLQEVVMVGIAAAIPKPSDPEKHVRLGDVVHASQVCQYDMLKREGEQIKNRAAPRATSARLSSAHSSLESERIGGRVRWHTNMARTSGLAESVRPSDAQDRLRQSPPGVDWVIHPTDPQRSSGVPRVFFGPIASGNQLLKSAAERDRIGREHGVLALEMEGSGVADACWVAGKSYSVIRGTCDYADEEKNDAWQGYAAVVAAAYLRGVLAALPCFQVPLVPGEDNSAIRRRLERCSRSNKSILDRCTRYSSYGGLLLFGGTMLVGALLRQPLLILLLMSAVGLAMGKMGTGLWFYYAEHLVWRSERVAGADELLREPAFDLSLLADAQRFLARCVERCVHA